MLFLNCPREDDDEPPLHKAHSDSEATSVMLWGKDQAQHWQTNSYVLTSYDGTWWTTCTYALLCHDLLNGRYLGSGKMHWSNWWITTGNLKTHWWTTNSLQDGSMQPTWTNSVIDDTPLLFHVFVCHNSVPSCRFTNRPWKLPMQPKLLKKGALCAGEVVTENIWYDQG